jgi:hypothetical protein
VFTDGTIDVDDIRDPPVVAVHQPSNVYPVLIGIGNAPNCVSEIFGKLVGNTVPPLGFHVIVTDAANALLAAEKHKTKEIKITNKADNRFSFLIVSSSPFKNRFITYLYKY